MEIGDSIVAIRVRVAPEAPVGGVELIDHTFPVSVVPGFAFPVSVFSIMYIFVPIITLP